MRVAILASTSSTTAAGALSRLRPPRAIHKTAYVLGQSDPRSRGQGQKVEQGRRDGPHDRAAALRRWVVCMGHLLRVESYRLGKR